MKYIILNFLSLFKRFRTATLLNLLGLSVAFAAFMVILMQVSYEKNFDHCHPTAHRVYRTDVKGDGFTSILTRPMIERVIHSSPHIQAGSLINPYLGSVYITITDNGKKNGYREPFTTCHAEITQVFDFPIVEGNKDCLKDPEKVIIPESMARKFFGKASAIGKAIHAEEFIWSKNRTDFTVGAVYKDFPGNTQLRNVIYTAMDASFAVQNWNASNYIGYVLLDSPESAKNVEDNFNAHFDYTQLKEAGNDNEIKLSLVPLTDIYYLNESQDGTIFRSGNAQTTSLLLLIAVLIIVVAIINFVNFSTALVPSRIKGINTRKVIGSSDRELRIGLLSEAIGISFFSFLLALLIIWCITSLGILMSLDMDLQLMHHMPIIVFSGCLSLVVGLIAGIYPSYYTTSFEPALVLKGSFGLSPKGRSLRTSLIGFQYVVSIVLIIASLFVHLQNRYMQQYKSGFDKEQIAIVELNGDIYHNHKEGYVNQLKSYPGIEDVAFSMQKLGSQDGYRSEGVEYKEKNIHFFSHAVSPSFFSVMGIQITDGRIPQPNDTLIYFNQKIKEEHQMEYGEILDFYGHKIRIGGFTDNINFSSLRNEAQNTAFIINEPTSLNVSYIRLKAGVNYEEAIAHIRKTMASIDPTYPYEIEFYDQIFNTLYHKEQKLSKLITLFSLLAVLISIVGIFGLVLFETQYRKKEIGVRKVFGSTIQEILILFNKVYIKIVCICFVIAVPIGYFAIHKWLENYAYKTPIHWWVFCFAFFVILLITLLTVTFQNWQAARANPVDSLKAE